MDTFDSVAEKIKSGGVGVIPTDTMYGIVASVFSSVAIEKVYDLRKRDKTKQCIVLIGEMSDLNKFGIELNNSEKMIIEKLWPGPFSIEFKVNDEKFAHLTRGQGMFAIRLPSNSDLQNLLKKAGPIIAPSANISEQSPAETLDEAKEYFPNLNYYLDGGKLTSNPSTVVSIVGDKVKIWRQGEGVVPTELVL